MWRSDVSCQNLPLSPGQQKLHIWLPYTSRAFVGGTISGVRVLKKTDYRPRRQEDIGAKIVDMIWRTKPPQSLLKGAVIADSKIGISDFLSVRSRHKNNCRQHPYRAIHNFSVESPCLWLELGVIVFGAHRPQALDNLIGPRSSDRIVGDDGENPSGPLDRSGSSHENGSEGSDEHCSARQREALPSPRF
jgi:hypothetical protein